MEQDEAFPDRAHLRNSRQLSWDRVPATATAQAAICALLAELEAAEGLRQRSRRAADRARLEGTLGAVVLDLFVAAGDDPEKHLAYSRRKPDYERGQRRYVHPDATATTIVQVAEFLIAAGYAEGHRGSYQRGDLGNRGYRSRVRATDKLVDFLAERGVTLDDVGVRENTELVRLKGPAATRGGPKALLPYNDTARTHQMRAHLRRWAEVAARFEIRPGAGHWDAGGRDQTDGDGGAGESMDRHRAHLYRVFNDGSWDAGGRFYGGWWMTMPAESRKSITIDGEPVAELDFKALHPRMAYHLCGRPLPHGDDPYDLGDRWAGVDRAVIKVAFNQLLAVGAGMRIRRPRDASLPRGVSYRGLLAALEAKHQTIRPWLRSARALELQHLDPLITEKVLTMESTSAKRTGFKWFSLQALIATLGARFGMPRVTTTCMT